MATNTTVAQAALTLLGEGEVLTDVATDNTRVANLLNARLSEVRDALLRAHPWNFAMEHATLKQDVLSSSVWKWDYSYQPPSDALRLINIEDESNNVSDEWTLSGTRVLTNIGGTIYEKTFGNADGSNQITITAHGFSADDAVVILAGTGTLPTGLAVSTLYYVQVIDADTIELATSAGGANVITGTGSGSGHTLQKRTVRCRYVKQITDPNAMDAMFREAFAAALAFDLAEAITGDRSRVNDMYQLLQERVRAARNSDGQEEYLSAIEDSEWLQARHPSGPFRGVPDGSGTPL